MRFDNGFLPFAYNVAAARKHFGNLNRSNNVSEHVARDRDGALLMCVSVRAMIRWHLWY
jgi:hypothetical protein